MRLTVAVCTWNRAVVLKGALESLVRARVPPGVSLTVLVVDNGCTDSTPEVAESFADALTMRYVVEARPGLSVARNRALREAEGDFVLWIDDDVLVTSDWLAAYVDAFRRWPDAVVFGGPIRPLLEAEPPGWLVRSLPRVGFAFAAHDLGEDGTILGPTIDRLPFGGNFALRADAIHGLSFREELGRRQDGSGRGGEEIAFVATMLSQGGEGRWVAGAVVEHRIGPDRQTAAYLHARCAADAIDDELAGTLSGRDTALPTLVARWVSAEVAYRVQRRVGRGDAWVDRLMNAGDSWGRLVARYRTALRS